MLNLVTATDDRITINAVIDFKESSTIEFTYVYDAANVEHIALQAAFDANT